MSTRNVLPSAARWATGGLLALALTATACSRKPSVSGEVTFNGQPLPFGTILFQGADGRVAHSLISDGRYTIADPPLGPVRITVRSHPVLPASFPGGGGLPPSPPEGLAPKPPDERQTRHVPIPERYRDPEQSGLTYTVRAGKQTHDVKLLP